MSQVVSAKHADISIASSGDNTVIAAISGKSIKVHQIWLTAVGGAVNLIFKDGASTSLNATAVPLTAAGSSMTFQYTGEPWWLTSPGNAFIINLSGAVSVTGRIYYTIA
jgi:hypothetical protein